MGQIGYGVSGRNGGRFSPLISGDRGVYAEVVGRRGGDGAVAVFRHVMDRRSRAPCARSGTRASRSTSTRADTCGWPSPPAPSNGWNAFARPICAAAAGPGTDVRLLDADAVRERIASGPALGGLLRRVFARVAPARLVYGLAGVVRAEGVRVVSDCRATRIVSGAVTADRGTVAAATVLPVWRPAAVRMAEVRASPVRKPGSPALMPCRVWGASLCGMVVLWRVYRWGGGVWVMLLPASSRSRPPARRAPRRPGRRARPAAR
ncbi:FAD-dependent oxidoreductase, partial [Streptomyces sp. NPDC093085]|uniref:FAD-dependent oxidoreductase n=1 Tax=Streptomyces sp. NPDC093085 TaxID=3155068 RepID=UPI0034466446